MVDGALFAITTKVESILILFANILDIASKYISPWRRSIFSTDQNWYCVAECLREVGRYQRGTKKPYIHGQTI